MAMVAAIVVTMVVTMIAAIIAAIIAFMGSPWNNYNCFHEMTMVAAMIALMGWL